MVSEDYCGNEASVRTGALKRAALIRRAFRLEWLTVTWMIAETAVAIGAGIAAHSLLLVVFGIDSIIEIISACVLIWRLAVELRRGRAFSEAAERSASRIAGALLFALAIYVVAGGAWGLWQHRGADFSTPGLILTVAAIPIMYVLSRQKLAVAEQLASPALRADAIESITCGWLSFVVVIGLLAQLTLGAWWVDSAASLAIVYFLIKEAREAWNGGECCD
ncbi:MAG TPA: cation transporter [Bryobacteraceae bacterium]|nr:cation transporter [Bryobacteraceae bacterium]